MSHNVHLQKRKEKFYKLAKEQGYRSRAAYKLIQLNKKFNFLNGARAAIDLCAAPGGWLQILSKYMPVSSMIIGVDILPIKPLPNVIAFQQDITTAACRQQLRKHLQGWQVDLVVHDGAPNVGGGSSWVKDSYVQNELVLCALKLACEFLVEDGTFVTKIFRSDDYMALTWVLKQFFKKVEVTKPIASREQSSEVFAVCTGYLAPKKIDPRIFEPNVVFKMHQDQQSANNKVLNVLHMKQHKVKNNRDGYADDVSMIQHKTATVTEYLNTANPSNVLAVVNEIVWTAGEGEDLSWIKSHPLTDDEIYELCKDLKVLSKGDFSKLIKWHKKLREYRTQLDAANGDVEANAIQEELIELTPEQLKANQEAALDAELDALQQRLAGRKKREAKKFHEKKMKELTRLAINANNMAERLPSENDDTLFHLSSFKNSDDVKLFKKSAKDIEKAGVDSAKFHEIITSKPTDMDSDLSDIEDKILGEMDPEQWESMSYQEQREAMVDMMYNRYKERKGIVTKRDKKTQAKLGADDGVKIGQHEEEQPQDYSDDDEHRKDEADLKKYSMNDSDDDEKKKKKKATSVDEVQDYLKKTHQTTSLIKKGEKETNMEQASRWFSQGIFEEIDIDNDDERKLYLKHQKKLQRLRQQQEELLQAKRQRYYNDDDENDADHEGDDEQPQQTAEPAAPLSKNAKKRKLFALAALEEDEKQEALLNIKKQKDNKSKKNDFDYNTIVNQDDTSDYHSSDAYSESDSTDSDDGAYDETFGSAHHGRGRWHGSAEDKDKELQKKLEKDAKAQAYLFKIQQMNNAQMEIAPAEREVSEYSDDSDARAEIIALGKKMLRKKSKQELIDSTYNKYTWNDRDDLPEWFVEDEGQHNTPQIPITKAEVLAVKAHFKAIDARPIHKIAEAQARKKKGAMRKIERQKIQADNIMNQEGVSSEQKMAQLAKIGKKTKKTEKVVKQYVMAQKNGKTFTSKLSKDNRNKKTWTVRVDRRMKRDKIGERRAEWRKKHPEKKGKK